MNHTPHQNRKPETRSQKMPAAESNKENRVIKVLHIIGLAHGGAGEHILSLAAGCDRSRFESTVVMASNSSMRPQFEQAGVRVLPLGMDHYGGLRKNLTAFRDLSRILRGERFDVIHTHTSVASVLGRVAAKLHCDVPVVHMLHTFAAHPYRGKAFRKAALFIERRLDRWTDCYVAGSQAMVRRGVTERVFSRDKVVLISNGIDLRRFDYDIDESCTSAASKANGSPIAMTVGFLGRLEKQKGVPYLIRAAALVHRDNPHIRFRIAGEGSMRPGLERLATELQVNDVVDFIGWTDSTRFLKEIDVLAMPSLWEAFGLSAAEAMALEKPVIASNIEGLPEVVEEGRTGLLVPPEDPAELARAILELAANPGRREAMGRLGRARVERLFSVDLMVRRHEELYERLTGGRASAPATNLIPAPKGLAIRTEEIPVSLSLEETATS